VEVAPTPLLVVEGVGSASGPAGDLVTVLVWVEAPDDLRLRRGLARDGEALRPQWTRWMRDEREHLARERTRERADLVVDGTGTSAPRPGRAARAPGSPEQT
jgi:uridine kinase